MNNNNNRSLNLSKSLDHRDAQIIAHNLDRIEALRNNSSQNRQREREEERLAKQRELSEKRINDSVKVLCKKAEQNPQFEEKLNLAVRHIFDYKIKCGFLSLELDDNGKYFVCPQYTELSSAGFEQAKEENIKLYLENF
jgi:hypothetical protein